LRRRFATEGAVFHTGASSGNNVRPCCSFMNTLPMSFYYVFSCTRKFWKCVSESTLAIRRLASLLPRFCLCCERTVVFAC
jgi:hypothetical protein